METSIRLPNRPRRKLFTDNAEQRQPQPGRVPSGARYLRPVGGKAAVLGRRRALIIEEEQL